MMSNGTEQVSSSSKIDIYSSLSAGRPADDGIFLVRTKGTVNLSAYKYLHFTNCLMDVNRGTGTFYLGVSTNANLTGHLYAASVSRALYGYDSATSVTETKAVDVGSLSGNYYVYFGMSFSKYTTGTGYIRVELVIDKVHLTVS